MTLLEKLSFWTEKTVLNIKRLAEEIAAGSDVNWPVHPTSKVGNVYPLGLAAHHGHLKACRLLLEAGADPNRGDIGSVSPLCKVIYGRREWFDSEQNAKFSVERMDELMSLLVGCGASPDGMPTEVGNRPGYYSPLYAAIRNGDYAAIEILAKIGADLEIVLEARHLGAGSEIEVVQGTPLFFALEKNAKAGKPRVGDQKAIVALLRAGANDACLASSDGARTPFQESVVAGRSEVVKYYVLERGENPAQLVGGVALADLAGNDATRAVLNALKSELAIQHALSDQAVGVENVMSPSRGKGMSPL